MVNHLMAYVPTHLYDPDTAESNAAALQFEDPDWTYTAIHDPAGTGLSYIEIRDEDGDVIGKF